MAQVLTFPKEFERHIFRDFDRSFAVVWWITIIVLYSLAYYLQGLPPKELSEEDIVRFQQVVYRIKPAPVKEREKPADTGVGADEKKEPDKVIEEKEPDIKEVEKPQTEVAKVKKRQKQKVDRQAKQESKRAKAVQLKKKTLLASTTAVGGRVRPGSAEAAKKVGITSGSLKGSNVQKATGFVSGAEAGETLKKLEHKGAIIADAGDDIEIASFEDMTPADQEIMFKEASLQLNENAITSTSRRGSKSAKRSRAVITEYVQKNEKQIRYCFWIYKKRDSSLKGRVVVEFTIEYSGKVSRAKINRRQTDWGGNKLGEEVERCIINTISSWYFEPIDRKEGSFTAGATYIFE